MEKIKLSPFKKLWPLFFAGLVLPMDLTKWHKTNFLFKAAPDYTSDKKSIFINSEDDLGGYFYRLDKEIPLSSDSKVKFQYQVQQFPKVSIKLPFDKKNDDYPVRLGLVIGGGEEADIPSAVKSRLGLSTKISNVLYFAPAKVSEKNIFCGDSPHNNYAIYCVLPSDLSQKEFELDVLKYLKQVKNLDYSASLLGLWIFADTDDSESKSSVKINNIEIVSAAKSSK
ncbi:MAG: hypothetical protein CL674_09300 [Bdellovibrionaceae bacterium]|nr:hypothetical protein [Pseudobdellovibrionaceae bacterium]|tara:strand:- start:79541 stop:80218 length:678 start_codon:yes stop_codon:yes gene_type:complete